jgi:MinD superfamily P-loop ATPase
VDAADLHLLLSPEIYHHENFASGTKAEIDAEKCTSCSLCEELCRFNAVEITGGVFSIDTYACEGCGLCMEVCPAGAISMIHEDNNHIFFSNSRFGPMIHGKLGIAEENSGRLVSKIRQQAKSMALENHAEYIIIDGPPGIGCPVISSVTGVDLVIAVTEPTLSGWHDLERLVKLTDMFYTTIYVIINKYDLNLDMTGTIENNLREKGILVLGKLAYDDAMIYALLESKTITEYQPGGLIANELNKMWESITCMIYESKRI